MQKQQVSNQIDLLSESKIDPKHCFTIYMLNKIQTNPINSMIKYLTPKVLQRFLPPFDQKNQKKIDKICQQSQNFCYKKLKIRLQQVTEGLREQCERMDYLMTKQHLHGENWEPNFDQEIQVMDQLEIALKEKLEEVRRNRANKKHAKQTQNKIFGDIMRKCSRRLTSCV